MTKLPLLYVRKCDNSKLYTPREVVVSARDWRMDMNRRCFWRFLCLACGVILCFTLDTDMNHTSAQEVRSLSTEEQYLEQAEQMKQEQEENRKEVIDGIHKYGATTLSEMEEASDKQEKKRTSGEADIEDIIKEKERFDMDQAYQVNRLKLFMITEYQKSGFESCITEELLWKVPFNTASGGRGLALFARGRDEENGKFEFCGEYVGSASSLDGAIPPSTEVIAGKFGEAVTGEKIQKIQYTYSDMYEMTLIYIVTEKQEYIIPYAESAEMYQAINKWSGLHNGTVYTMSKFMREMNRLFDEKSQLEGDGDLIGGRMPIREGIYVEPWMAALAGGVAVGICIICMYLRKKFFPRKKRVNQNNIS